MLKLDIRTTLIVLLCIALAVLSTCHSCQVKKLEGKLAECEKDFTASKDDNPVLSTRIDSIPYKVEVPVYTPKYISYIPKGYVKKTSSLPDIEVVPLRSDTAGNDYFAPATEFHDVSLDDVLVYPDTLKSQYGYVAITDTVTQNQIKSRSVSWNLLIPNTTTTITNTIRKPMFYASIDGYGNKEGINGVGLGIMYSSPRALNYEAGFVLNEQTGVNYKAGIKIPLGKK
jgi:hypothetical protein